MQTVSCEECGGAGIDPGSLREPEECPRCCGAGYLLAPAEVERIARKVIAKRKAMGRAETSLPLGWHEERKFRVGE